MTFTFAPAVRDRVGLIIGLAGASGSGKTLSALKVARGLAGGDDSRIAFIDTEGGRGKHYAPAPGESPSETRFGFRHGDLKPPFTPEAYLAAIDAADRAGFEVVVIDSFSHSWDGEGGLQDAHDALVDQAVERARQSADEKGWRFDEGKERDRASVGAWKVKTGFKRVVSRLLQCRAHLVICMRADEKMRMETVEEEGRNGRTFKKTVIIQPKDLPVAERWVPIVEKRFPYELTTSLLLTPSAPGVPVPIKLQEQHRSAIALDRPLDEAVGRALAEWARGGAAPAGREGEEYERGGATRQPARKPATSARQADADPKAALFTVAREKARQGNAVLNAWIDAKAGRWDAVREIADELNDLAADADDRPGDERGEAA